MIHNTRHTDAVDDKHWCGDGLVRVFLFNQMDCHISEVLMSIANQWLNSHALTLHSWLYWNSKLKARLKFFIFQNCPINHHSGDASKNLSRKGENRSGVGGVVSVAALYTNIIFLCPCINTSERYLQLKGSNARDACMGPLSLKLCVSLN